MNDLKLPLPGAKPAAPPPVEVESGQAKDAASKSEILLDEAAAAPDQASSLPALRVGQAFSCVWIPAEPSEN